MHHALAALAAALWLLPCAASSQTAGWPAVNSSISDGRDTIRVLGHVDNNAALKLATGTTNSQGVHRLGFAGPGDGGAATYFWSPTNCTAADNGAQVQPSGATGCWIANFSGMQPTPEIWGAKGDGVADDAPQINAALAYMGTRGSGTVYGRSGKQYGIASTLTLKAGTTFSGAGFDASKLLLLNNTINPAIDMEAQTVLQNWNIDATPQTVGTVIRMGNSSASYFSLISRVKTTKGCIALDVNGVSHTVRDSSFELMRASTECGGVRVGHNTQAGTIEFRMVDSLIKCDYTQQTRAAFNMLLEDAAGIFSSNNDLIGCTVGTVIKPGVNQQVAQIMASNTVQGDTNLQAGLLIDTGDPTARVFDNRFINGWTGGALSPLGQGVVIKNTGGGKIEGTTFIGHRAMQNFTNAIQIMKPVAGTISGTVFDMLRVCNTQTGMNVFVGDDQELTLRNSRLGKACDGYTAGHTDDLVYGVGLGLNVQLIAIGNDLSYGGLEPWTPISGVPTRNSIVANNTIDLTAGPTYAAANTVTLNLMSKRYHLTAAGAATVNTITPAWHGQEICLIGENLAGAITFGTSGNIRFPATIPTGGGMVCGYYDSTFSKWVLH